MTTDEDMIHLKSQCVAPLMKCPRGLPRPDCPFAPVRKMEIVQSIRWLKERSACELRLLLAHHRSCSTGQAEGMQAAKDIKH